MNKYVLSAIAIIALAAGCNGSPAPQPVQTSKCHAIGTGLYMNPDPSCTPGAINPNVTQANIHQTICVKGWTATVRPPVTYTKQLKYKQMADYGFTDDIRSHEEDHYIPIELGGSPDDPKNLWPEYGASPNPKDAVENLLNVRVCSGQITLSEAQREISTDWTKVKVGGGLE